ncbi:elongation factor P [Patescibacteria group bacterium]|nr:elongation factor P [Patescibacteria group bacterium]
MNNLKMGRIISVDNQPYLITYTQHVQMGRGSAILRTKLKNLISGQVLEKTYKAGDKIDEADLSYRQSSFLYQENNDYYFMDTESYDQFFLSATNVDGQKDFLKEGLEIKTMLFQNKPVGIELPKKVELKVIQTEPGIRGDTAQGSVTKPAILETGSKVNVPLFINQGDLVRVNTETGQYVERV